VEVRQILVEESREERADKSQMACGAESRERAENEQRAGLSVLIGNNRY
jgi:hypothetical protein